jgi:hypothetical protein
MAFGINVLLVKKHFTRVSTAFSPLPAQVAITMKK